MQYSLFRTLNISMNRLDAHNFDLATIDLNGILLMPPVGDDVHQLFQKGGIVLYPFDGRAFWCIHILQDFESVWPY